MAFETATASPKAPTGVRPDLTTPLTIALRARLRQAVIWSSSVVLMVIYFITSKLRGRDGGGHAADFLEILDLALLLSWATASLGDRPSLPGLPRRSLRRPDLLFRHSASSLTLLRVGVALADALVVVVGTVAVSAACGFAPRGPREWLYVVEVSILIGASTSLQLELIWMFSNRAIALLAAALLTAAALHFTHAGPSAPGALLGRLGFPVSALASATEEPFRLDLAARALAAGVAYDLALVATLFALSGNRARG
jgi:hypothetical protein